MRCRIRTTRGAIAAIPSGRVNMLRDGGRSDEERHLPEIVNRRGERVRHRAVDGAMRKSSLPLRTPFLQS